MGLTRRIFAVANVTRGDGRGHGDLSLAPIRLAPAHAFHGDNHHNDSNDSNKVGYTDLQLGHN